MTIRLSFLMFIFLLPAAGFLKAQAPKPATWSYEVKKTVANEYDLIFKLDIRPGTHVYSQFIGSDGPIPTSFHFDKNSNYTLVDSVKEMTKPIKVHDKMFDMDLLYFEDSAVFVQHIKMINPVSQVSGGLEFMACDGTKCYPPAKLNFAFNIPK